MTKRAAFIAAAMAALTAAALLANGSDPATVDVPVVGRLTWAQVCAVATFFVYVGSTWGEFKNLKKGVEAIQKSLEAMDDKYAAKDAVDARLGGFQDRLALLEKSPWHHSKR